jgi:hypothetical protein
MSGGDRSRIKVPEIADFAEQVAHLDDDECARVLYVNHIGRVFATLAIFEHTLVWALLGVDRIKVGENRAATTAATRHLAKRDILRSLTLGNLIAVLSKHEVEQRTLVT